MDDPTYDRKEIAKNPVYNLAFIISEITNDLAPVGWGRNILLAESLLYHFDITPKTPYGTGEK